MDFGTMQLNKMSFEMLLTAKGSSLCRRVIQHHGENTELH